MASQNGGPTHEEWRAMHLGAQLWKTLRVIVIVDKDELRSIIQREDGVYRVGPGRSSAGLSMNVAPIASIAVRTPSSSIPTTSIGPTGLEGASSVSRFVIHISSYAGKQRARR
jgi:hypothetical protein